MAVEQALGLQTALELFIGHLQRADARGLDIGGVDLVGAVPLIEGHKAPHQNHHAIFRLKLKPHGIAPEHDAPYSGGIVLQREVDMTGAVMPHHIGELPLHIYFPQPGILLQGGADKPVELRYSEHRSPAPDHRAPPFRAVSTAIPAALSEENAGSAKNPPYRRRISPAI